MTPLTINLSKIPYPKLKGARIIGDSLGKYTMKEAKAASPISTVETFDIKSNTAFLLNNGKKNFVAQLAPELQRYNVLEKDIEKRLAELYEESNDIKGVIVGGWDSTNKESFDLPVFIADIFDKFGVDFSMICGKRKGTASENLVTVNTNTTIWGDKIKTLIDKLDVRKATRADIQQALEKEYEVVELSDKIPIKVIDKFNGNTQKLVLKQQNGSRINP